jgi:hypothetical protein
MAVKVAARSKAWTIFVRSNAGIVGSNPTEGMDVCVCVYSVFVLFLYVGSYLATGWSPSKESYRLCKKRLRTEEEAGAQQSIVGLMKT